MAQCSPVTFAKTVPFCVNDDNFGLPPQSTRLFVKQKAKNTGTIIDPIGGDTNTDLVVLVSKSDQADKMELLGNCQDYNGTPVLLNACNEVYVPTTPQCFVVTQTPDSVTGCGIGIQNSNFKGHQQS